MTQAVDSFDVFDTLIGRKCFQPDGIFDEVEKLSAFGGFKKMRILAEQQATPKTFDAIYKNFQNITGCSETVSNALKVLELEREYSNIFPIQRNMDKVKDGDVLISDTYFDAQQLKLFLAHVGFTKNVKIYASYDGKHNGWIWPEIKKTYKINSHTGDNHHADVIKPSNFLIKTNYFDAKMYKAEQTVERYNSKLSKIMRFLRLKNPYYGIKGTYWARQSQYNFPILIAASHVLHDLCLKNGYNRILFATRDGTHWKHIYQKFFSEDVVEFHTSRHMLQSNNIDYENYVRSIYNEKSVIVDVNTRGINYFDFIKKLKMPCNLLTLNTINPALNKESYLNLGTVTLGEQFEILNYDLVGTMTDYVNGSVIRDEVEYDCDVIRTGHECINLGLQMLSQHEISDIGRHVIYSLMEQMPGPLFSLDTKITLHRIHGRNQ